VNKHLYLCHPLVLSSPTLMMHGQTNLKAHWYSFKYLSHTHARKHTQAQLLLTFYITGYTRGVLVILSRRWRI